MSGILQRLLDILQIELRVRALLEHPPDFHGMIGDGVACLEFHGKANATPPAPRSNVLRESIFFMTVFPRCAYCALGLAGLR